MPNGDPAGDFNGANQYLTIPANVAFSIPTTWNLTWEAWIRPDVVQFPNENTNGGFVDYMGKCRDLANTDRATPRRIWPMGARPRRILIADNRK